eukprot:scaffold106652_cov22-Tisochrysis_lutea.AAC.2
MDGAMLLAQASSRLATEQQQQQQQQQSTVGNGGSSSKRPSSDGAHGMPTALQQQQQLPSQQRGVLYPPGVVVDGTDDEAEGSEADGEGKQAEAAPAPAPPVATNQFGILPANSMQDLPAQHGFWSVLEHVLNASCLCVPLLPTCTDTAPSQNPSPVACRCPSPVAASWARSCCKASRSSATAGHARASPRRCVPPFASFRCFPVAFSALVFSLLCQKPPTLKTRQCFFSGAGFLKIRG